MRKVIRLIVSSILVAMLSLNSVWANELNDRTLDFQNFTVDDVDHFIEQGEKSEIDYWVFGHHHYNSDIFEIGNTKLLTNQLGYVRSKEHFGYRNNPIFEI